MNEQLQQALATLLSKATTGVEAGVGFLSAELPDVIHQILLWKAAESFAYFTLSLVLVVFSIVFLVKQSKRKLTSPNDYRAQYRPTLCFDRDGDVTGVGLTALFVVTAVGLIGLIGITNLAWLQIWVAPKVYLIEYAAELAK